MRPWILPLLLLVACSSTKTAPPTDLAPEAGSPGAPAPGDIADVAATPADAPEPEEDLPGDPGLGPDPGDGDTSSDPDPVTFEGHRSFATLTTSNGLGAATFNAVDAVLTGFFDHTFKHLDADTPAIDYLFDAFVGVRIGSQAVWLKGVEPVEAGYHGGTGVIRVVQQVPGLRVESHWFMPFHAQAGRILALAVRVTNVGPDALKEVSAATLWNLHLGGEGTFDGEAVSLLASGALEEKRGEVRAIYRSLGAAEPTADNGGDEHNPYGLFLAGQPFAGTLEPEAGDDIVVGFETAIGALEPEESVWLGTVVALGPDEEAVEAFVAGRGAEEILGAELDWWAGWHAVEAPPAGLSDDELAVYRQSTAMLLMGQIREAGKGRGQILASLPPGIWNIAWVRDAVYAILALVRSGHHEEARLGLEFMLGADLVPGAGGGNHYQEVFIESTDASDGTWGLGVDLSADYLISVTRYFGSGLEESDANAAGPNIEWDNWGLFLWAWAEYLEASGDTAFATVHDPTVHTRVADLLVELVDPQTGLLLPDSSIWERHWCPHGSCEEPDTRKRHAYSSIVAAHGLERVGYSEEASALAQAIRDRLVVEVPTTGLPALAGNFEELDFPVYWLDLAVVEAIVTGVLDPEGDAASGTFAAFDEHLKAGEHSPGYVRNDDPTWYDRQEWVVMDLRAASALVRMGRQGAAKTLVGWITSQARANFDIIAELLSDGIYQAGTEDDDWEPGQDAGGDYQGAIPMCGFGAGAYVLALHDLHGG